MPQAQTRAGAEERQSPPTPDPGQTAWRLIRNRNFAFLWASQALTQIGDSLIKVALVWFVYTLTGSTMKTTIIGLLQTIPPFLLGPLLGVYLDRWQKKPVMVVVNLSRALMIVSIPILHSLHLLSLNGLYVLVFLIAVVSALFGPALFSAVALIAPRHQLTGANALLQSTTTMGMLVGPALSGAGIALMGTQNVLYLGAPAFLAAAWLLLPVSIKESLEACPAAADLTAVWNDMVVGLRFLFIQSPLVRLLMITSVLYSLAASAFVFLLPVFSTRVLQAGSVELGWLWSAYGAGMLLVSIWLAFVRQDTLDRRVLLIAGSMVLGGIASFGLSLAHALVLATILTGMVGGSLALFTPVTWGMLQELTAANLRGRVFTILSSGAMLASMVGMLAFGWSADALGPGVSLIGMGVVLIGTGLVALLLMQHEKKYDAIMRAKGLLSRRV
jgi:DHA3 family macrolide efflux protein-like MFS transporter